MVRSRKSAAGRRREPRRRHVPPLGDVAAAFRDHDLFTYASALAFRVLASLVPLTLLGLALLGAFGLEDVWRDELAPALAERVTAPVYSALDSTVERIFDQDALLLILFGAGLAFWHVARGMRIVMKALNRIHDAEESREPIRLVLTDGALALVLILGFASAFLVVTALPRIVGGGGASVALRLLAWLAAAAILGVVVAVLVRYAPAERPEASWASAGSIAIVVAWSVASAAFGWWAGSVANYESAVGALLAFLVLTTYVLVSCSIFLGGAQLDELARKSNG